MRSRAVRAQARLTAVAELLEAPVFSDEMDGASDCASGLIAAASAADDGYCSLCRRCQMRRKLEKRLQKKKDEEDDVCIVEDVEDERTIEEIMEFIGEDNSKSRKRRRRRRRKRSQNDVDGIHAHDAPSPGGSGSGSSVGDNDVVGNALTYKDGFQNGVQHLGMGHSVQQHVTSRRNHEHDHPVCCEGHHGCHNDSNTAQAQSKVEVVDGITPEQEAEIEREVEEFRMRLACEPPARNLPRVAIPNF